jgi:hypothetical protein
LADIGREFYSQFFEEDSSKIYSTNPSGNYLTPNIFNDGEGGNLPSTIFK